MSDGLTDRRSEKTYKCSVCKEEKYQDDFFNFTKKICYLCQSKKPYPCSVILPQEEVDALLVGLSGSPVDEVEGMKFDQDKLRYDLIPAEVKKWLAEVLTYGAKKYAPDNWKKIEVERYYAAMERHMVAYQLGEEKDPESGIHHLIHMMCNAMFICWLEHYKKE